MSREEGCIFKKLVCKPNYLNAIEVRIFETEEQMYNNAKKWNLKNKNRYCLTDDYDAITLENLPNTTKDGHLIFSTIFFHKNKLSYEILLHELGHATFVFFRNILRFDGKFKKINNSGDDEEEIFCYTQEGFFNNLLNLLNDNGISINV